MSYNISFVLAFAILVTIQLSSAKPPAAKTLTTKKDVAKQIKGGVTYEYTTACDWKNKSGQKQITIPLTSTTDLCPEQCAKDSTCTHWRIADRNICYTFTGLTDEDDVVDAAAKGTICGVNH